MGSTRMHRQKAFMLMKKLLISSLLSVTQRFSPLEDIFKIQGVRQCNESSTT